MKMRAFHCLAAFAAAWIVTATVDAERPVQLGLALFTCIGWLWISEAIHISVTALLVPVLASLSGLFPVAKAFESFANPVIFLFMGGFALATALQKYELDRLVALRIMRASRGVPLVAVLLLFLATALVSMWISNTATVAMMLPLALGLLAGESPEDNPRLYLFVLLGVAYAGNIGGIATLIGSPPNAIAASVLGLDFMGWLGFGLPAFAVMFPLMALILLVLTRPVFDRALQLEVAHGSVDPRRRWVITIFVVTAAGWIFSSPLAAFFGVEKGFDSVVAVAAIIMLITSRAVTFEEFAARTNWGILILFGGGLALSAALQSSGASAWLADAIIGVLPVDQPWLVLLIVCLFVIFLTELVSNTASAALLVPLFIAVAPELQLAQRELVVMIAVCASCAFMLPVATPPNALVFGTGHIPQRRMIQAGLVLNIVFAVVLSIMFRWMV